MKNPTESAWRYFLEENESSPDQCGVVAAVFLDSHKVLHIVKNEMLVHKLKFYDLFKNIPYCSKWAKCRMYCITPWL